MTAIDWTLAGYAVALLGLGAVLLVLEFFVVSFGLLAAGAAASTVAALYLAFLAGEAVGWVLLVSVPLLAWHITRWGLGRIRRSHVVPKSEIRSEAGYHHATERLGVGPGSVGVMVTPARPSGRARFPGGECDVQTRGRPLESAARVVVVAIDGPTVFVRPAGDEDPPPPGPAKASPGSAGAPPG